MLLLFILCLLFIYLCYYFNKEIHIENYVIKKLMSVMANYDFSDYEDENIKDMILEVIQSLSKNTVDDILHSTNEDLRLKMYKCLIMIDILK